MKIWLINTAERLSFDAGNGRKMRMGLLAAHLIDRGDEVTWWTSCFNHVEKTMYADATMEEERGGLTLVRLKARGYRDHFSFARFADHAAVAHEFGRVAARHVLPDLIVCSYPTIEIAAAATAYGRRHGVPVIVDVRDMWPDVIGWMVPKRWRVLGPPTVAVYGILADRALRRATTLTGITGGFVEWALARAGRVRTERDRAITFCHEPLEFAPQALADAEAFWQRAGLADDGRKVVLFVGSFARSLDLRPVIEAAKAMPDGPVFVLCGDGDMDAEYRRAAAGATNVIMPGWVSAAEVHAVLARAAVAISPLADRPDFKVTINNKFVEYLSGGVPILVSPADSHCAKIVEVNDCGQGFDLADPAALAARIGAIVDDEARLARWRTNATRLFEERFTTERILGQWDAVIEETMRA